MTTLTTLLGLAPMLLTGGEGAELRAPLALTLMSGLASSTLLTLFLIPSAYLFIMPEHVHKILPQNSEPVSAARSED